MRYFEEYKKVFHTSYCINEQIIDFQNVHQILTNKINLILVSNSNYIEIIKLNITKWYDWKYENK